MQERTEFSVHCWQLARAARIMTLIWRECTVNSLMRFELTRIATWASCFNLFLVSMLCSIPRLTLSLCNSPACSTVVGCSAIERGERKRQKWIKYKRKRGKGKECIYDDAVIRSAILFFRPSAPMYSLYRPRNALCQQEIFIQCATNSFVTPLNAPERIAALQSLK